jgi:hypothetical protein
MLVGREKYNARVAIDGLESAAVELVFPHPVIYSLTSFMLPPWAWTCWFVPFAVQIPSGTICTEAVTNSERPEIDRSKRVSEDNRKLFPG